MITLEQLRIFVAVAEREHLTQAANALRLTPSALSTSIHNLENNFNLALFYRVGRQIKLSEVGKVFLEEARSTLQRAAMTERLLEELSGLSRGSLILYASQTIANYWLPPLLSAFNDEYPAVTIDLTIVNSDKVARAVQEGICDIGFIETNLHLTSVQRDHIMDDQLLVVTSPRLASEISIKFDKKTKDINYQLYKLSWIMREEGSGTRSSFYHAIETAGLDADQIKVKFTLPSNEAVLSAVLSGNYAAPLSQFVVQHYIKANMLAVLPFKLEKRPFSLLRNKARYQSPAMLKFLENISSMKYS
ncbi:LysR substrate-binding domain-containing protein [Bartonella sp. HY329]|uniref:LysR substrate-binding domain-containing protein n=1 Tax=unclassified Bartonella TaxID=2645622 RepID=UPI0021C86880|nr:MULTISPECIES: LysR substrate-binding domain-containing protein [unclassified Bartonella]UXM94118.1 LysR substrate-binding domain-containing protein [Bartonella sp. HY329]UXN08440.1 LysR substrate-binding domain-containing protein [Bartonella sp. HY328]